MSCKQMRMLLTVVLFTLGMSCAKASTVLAGFATEDITPPLNNLHPVSVFYGEVPVEGIGANREYDNGPVDTKLRVLKFMQDDKLAGLIVNYSVHNVILPEQMREYSAANRDWNPIIVGYAEKFPAGVESGGMKLGEVASPDRLRSAKSGWFYDPLARLWSVKIDFGGRSGWRLGPSQSHEPPEERHVLTKPA